MDERELQELFHDAPGEAPPPSFGVTDVAAASKRATARHRMRVATASSAAVLVLVGGGLFATYGLGGGNGGNTGGTADELAASAPEFDAQSPRQPSSGDGRQQNGDSEAADAASSKQGDEANEKSGPGVARTERCAAVDRQLATALAGELPVDPTSDAVLGQDAVPGQFECPDIQRQAAYRVSDDGRVGTVSVALTSPETVRAMSRANSRELSRAPQARATTDDGRVILVMSIGDADDSPYADELQKIADALAKRF